MHIRNEFNRAVGEKNKIKIKTRDEPQNVPSRRTNSQLAKKKILIRWQNQLFRGMQLAVHLTQRGYLIFYIKPSAPRTYTRARQRKSVRGIESVAAAVTALAIPPTMSTRCFVFSFFNNSHVTQKDASRL